jgi:hypothetical protein
MTALGQAQKPDHCLKVGRYETLAENVFFDPWRAEHYPFRGGVVGAITSRLGCRECSDRRG